MVLYQQPVQKLESSLRRNGPPDADFGWVMTDLRIKVAPAVRRKHGTVDLPVQVAQPSDRRIPHRGIVNEVVELGQSKRTAEHEFPTLCVEGPTDLVQRLGTRRTWKG